jgi:dUTP pyrophosphatase
MENNLIINVKLDEFAELPKKNHESDSGYDIVATSEPELVSSDGYNLDYIQYKTGVKVAIQDKNHDIFLMPRSSISKYNLLLCNSVGLVDNEYRGELLFRFKYIYQQCDIDRKQNPFGVNYNKIYKKGDKIGQMVVRNKVFTELRIVEELDDTIRSEKGFGSSGN